VSRSVPRDPAPASKASVASNVVPYEVFLRARARLEQEPAGSDAVRSSRSGQQGTPAEPRGKARAGSRNIPEAILAEVRGLPDVRPAKVREARRRIRMGFYDRPEVLEEIVRRLLEDDLQLGDGPSAGGVR
jgi:hypothetical protein